MAVEYIHAHDNPTLKRIRQLLRDGASYRRSGWLWVEGDHLIRAAVARAWSAQTVVWTREAMQAWPQGLALDARHVEVEVAQMRELSTLETPAKVGALFAFKPSEALEAGVPTVVLDRLQDPGNAGSILRSASAMGFRQVLALRGTVALWSPKVVRAGMGAHFHLHIVEQAAPEALAQLQLPVLATSSHQGDWLHQAQLPWPCAWLMGHEGQCVDEALMAQATQTLRITQPGGEESLNVAAAAAICLHASAISAQASGYN